MCRIPCLILCLADVERVGQCRAPNARCGVHGRMASVIASLFSRSRPPPPAGLHATTPIHVPAFTDPPEAPLLPTRVLARSQAEPAGKLARAPECVDVPDGSGVVARILTGPHDAHRQDSHLPMRYDTGRPRAVIRLRISQPRTTSLPCPAGLRARRPSPMMDLYRKNAFSTRP